MKKEVRVAHGTYQLLLGTRMGEKYWLEKATFDCGWYWGVGYVEHYTGNGAGDKTWRGHSHFDYLFLKGPSDCKTMFDNFFEETPFTGDEIWKILELMQSVYTCRRYSDMLYTGGSHITRNPMSHVITNKEEYGRLNNGVIPLLLNELYKIMAPEDVECGLYHDLNPVVSWGDEEEDHE